MSGRLHRVGRDMRVTGSPIISKPQLDELYALYNYRKWVHPDPLEFLYHYADQKDREVVGLIASSLAYGRVAQILKSAAAVLDRMGPSPHRFLMHTKPAALKRTFQHFKHRFTTSEEFVWMLKGLKRVIGRHGSLYACFLTGYRENGEEVLPALSFFVKELTVPFKSGANSLLPLPERGSACKRLNLFLRWMVRKDRVDPGGWHEVSPSRLIIPLDTHMHRICLLLGLTTRKNAGMRTAMEITGGFREIEPEDPVRYDFALTRLGIRDDADLGVLDEMGVRRSVLFQPGSFTQG